MTGRKRNYIKTKSKGFVCLKRKLPDMQTARDVLKSMRKRGVTSIYRCKLCGSLHLTSMRVAKKGKPSNEADSDTAGKHQDGKGGNPGPGKGDVPL